LEKTTMSSTETLHIPARDIPVPNSISPEAQAALTMLATLRQPPAYPALDDLSGWEAYVNRGEAMILAMSENSELEAQIASEPRKLGDVPGYLVHPRQGYAEDRIIYYIHGGALVLGGGETCRCMAKGTALGLGAKLYAVDYRMPPHHPYPTPLQDCLEGYHYLLQHYQPEQIVLHGASAGGNLAAALVLRLQAEAAPLPAGVILVTPELDLTESGDSFAVMTGVDVMLKGPLMPANLLYANGHDLADPYLSPLFGDFSHGFPPALLTAGTRDLFLSNAVRMHNALRRAGNHSELCIEEAMPHGGFLGNTVEDAALTADIRNFAERAWSGKLRAATAR
jgi:acetyl esterase/lipase